MPAIDAWLVPSAIVCPRSGVCLLWCSAIWSPKPPAVHLTVPLPSVLVTRQDITINQHINMLVAQVWVKVGWYAHATHVDKACVGGDARPFWRSTPPTPLSRQGNPPPLEACIDIFVYVYIKAYFSFIEGKAFGSPGKKCVDICQYCCKKVEI